MVRGSALSNLPVDEWSFSTHSVDQAVQTNYVDDVIREATYEWLPVVGDALR